MAEHIADGGARVYIVRRIGHAYPSGEKLFTRDVCAFTCYECAYEYAKTIDPTDTRLASGVRFSVGIGIVDAYGCDGGE